MDALRGRVSRNSKHVRATLNNNTLIFLLSTFYRPRSKQREQILDDIHAYLEELKLL